MKCFAYPIVIELVLFNANKDDNFNNSEARKEKDEHLQKQSDCIILNNLKTREI